jgi:hypothetical protein
VNVERGDEGAAGNSGGTTLGGNNHTGARGSLHGTAKAARPRGKEFS